MRNHRERPTGRSTRIGRTLRILGERRRADKVVPPVEPAGRNRRRSAAPPPSPSPAPGSGFRSRALVLKKRATELLAGIGRRLRPALAPVGKAIAVLLCLAGVIAVARLIDRHIRSSPAFALSEVQLEGTRRLSEEDVREVGGLRLGENVFASSPEEVKARLEGHPWIMSATVGRRLPGSFDVQIREHEAVAVVAMAGSDDSAGTMFLLGEEGTLFKRVSPNDTVDLPVVSGMESARITDDEAWRTSTLLGIVALFHDYRGAGLWRRAPIAEVHVEEDDGLSLYVGRDPVYVRLGNGPYRQKLHRLKQVFDRLEAEGTPPEYVLLDNVRRPDRVTVRLRPLPPPVSDAASDAADAT